MLNVSFWPKPPVLGVTSLKTGSENVAPGHSPVGTSSAAVKAEPRRRRHEDLDRDGLRLHRERTRDRWRCHRPLAGTAELHPPGDGVERAAVVGDLEPHEPVARRERGSPLRGSLSRNWPSRFATPIHDRPVGVGVSRSVPQPIGWASAGSVIAARWVKAEPASRSDVGRGGDSGRLRRQGRRGAARGSGAAGTPRAGAVLQPERPRTRMRRVRR